MWLVRREDYETFRRLLPDVEWPEAFEQWLQACEQRIAEYDAQGDEVVKVVVDPKKFARWCRQSGVDHNRATIDAYAVALGRKQRETGD